MSQAGFEPKISASETPHTNALDRAATRTSYFIDYWRMKTLHGLSPPGWDFQNTDPQW
jgi:hypothetical protein